MKVCVIEERSADVAQPEDMLKRMDYQVMTAGTADDGASPETARLARLAGILTPDRDGPNFVLERAIWGRPCGWSPQSAAAGQADARFGKWPLAGGHATLAKPFTEDAPKSPCLRAEAAEAGDLAKCKVQTVAIGREER